MTTLNELLEKITALQQCHNLSDRAIGLGATKDHKIVQKLRAGKNITVTTLDNLIKFIDEYEDKHPKSG